MSKFKEYRTHIRYHVRLPATIAINGQQHDGITTDVSLNGAFICFNTFNPLEARIHTDANGLLDLALKPAGNEYHFKAECKIKHITKTGVGLFFERPEGKNVDALRQVFNDVLHLIINETMYICTPENRLAKLNDWNKDIAQALAIREDIIMTARHWIIIKHLRKFYQEYKHTPNQSMFLKYLNKQSLFENFKESEFYLLFRDGIERNGTRIAGLPEPLEEVTSDEQDAASKPKSVNAAKRSEIITINFEGRDYPFDSTGNLIDIHMWNERLAIFIAEKEGISLTQAHWEILHNLRKFYAEYSVVPNVKVLIKQAKKKFSYHITKEYLYNCFPKGPSRQGSKIAGVPEPQDCID